MFQGESEHSTNEADKQNEGEHARENKPEKVEGVERASETTSPASNEAATTETAEAVSAANQRKKQVRWLRKHHLQKQNLSLTRKQKQSLKELANNESKPSSRS